MRRLIAASSVLLLCSLGLHAQKFSVGPCSAEDTNTGTGSSSGHGNHACEIRRATLPLQNGQVDVAGTNGGISVMGEDRTDIALEARVQAQGSSPEQAESLLHDIRILTDGQIRADGPTGHSWSVNFRLRVPRRLAAKLRTENGGIELASLDGNITAQTTNGGLQLRDLAGDVHASTTNGGLQVALGGNQWHGAGLLARSVNGPVSVKAPGDYSAHLIAQTVNGLMAINFPGAPQSNHHHIDTNLGQGGPTVQFETVNGPVAISHD